VRRGLGFDIRYEDSRNNEANVKSAALARLLLAAAIMLGVMLAALGEARAHQVNLSTARVMLNGDRTVSIEVGLKGSDADRLAGTTIFDAQRDQVDPARVAASATPIIAYVSAHVAVTGGDGKPCASSAAALAPDGDGVLFRQHFDCSDVGGDIVYRSTVLTDTDPAARQVVLIGEGDSAPQALLDAANTTITLSAPPPSRLSTFEGYLVTGIEHILLGYDHIAFLIAIVLWARRLFPVIKIVTAFTIAHSITLSLAALGIVVMPSAVVEPAIAASIVFVALENFFSDDIDRRWRVTFAFGLIHGFGFAGALKEVGLPPNAIAIALASFNIGVEIGQIAIVSIVIPLLIGLDRLLAGAGGKPVRAAPLVYALSSLIAVLGSYWLITRIVAEIHGYL
jgi:hydrogenase/urease accessory protein HupE